MTSEQEIFLGRLGKNPDLQYTINNKAICYLSVAINKNGDEAPEWKRVIVVGPQAESCSVYLKKGREVFICGTSQIKEFVNMDGVKKQCIEVLARLVGFPNV